MCFINPVSIDKLEKLMKWMVDPSMLDDGEKITYDINLQTLLGIDKIINIDVYYYFDLDGYTEVSVR